MSYKNLEYSPAYDVETCVEKKRKYYSDFMRMNEDFEGEMITYWD